MIIVNSAKLLNSRNVEKREVLLEEKLFSGWDKIMFRQEIVFILEVFEEGSKNLSDEVMEICRADIFSKRASRIKGRNERN